MISATFPQTFWFTGLSLIFLVFFLLDGFDMGIGMALPFFSKSDSDRKILLDVVWPFWDGNELWAIIGGACLFAAFPHAFVALIGGLAPFVALLLSCLMFRTISFEAWYKDSSRRRFWEYVQAAGSFFLSFGLGFLVGNLIAGLPISDTGNFAGTPASALQPYALAAGLLSSSGAVVLGATYLRKKTEGAVRDKATLIARGGFPVVAFLGALTLIWTAFIVPEVRTNPLFRIGAVCAAAAGIGLYVSLGRAGDRLPFYLSGAAVVSVWVAGSSALFPYLVRPSSGGPGLSLSKAASPESSLAFLAGFAVIALAIVAGYTVFAYRVFKGKADRHSEAH
ncbi:MAG: cytochrome d ubiquinol oxidase subunit II [Treponemataceae bacterium]